MKVSKHFMLGEFVNPDYINHPHIGTRCLDWLNCRLIPTVQLIRDHVGALVINDWLWGGKFVDSGLRVFNDNKYAGLSSHKGGNCVDLKPRDMSCEELYYHILNNQHLYPYISRIESIEHTPTWVHVEVSTSIRIGDVVIFRP